MSNEETKKPFSVIKIDEGKVNKSSWLQNLWISLKAVRIVSIIPKRIYGARRDGTNDAIYLSKSTLSLFLRHSSFLSSLYKSSELQLSP